MAKPTNNFAYTLLAYILMALGLVIVAFIIGLVMHWAVITRHLWTKDNDRWIGFIFFTLLMFAVVTKQSKRHWRSSAFWVAITSLFAVHVVSFWFILRYVEHWDDFWFLVMCVAESPLITYFANWMVSHSLRCQ